MDDRRPYRSPAPVIRPPRFRLTVPALAALAWAACAPAWSGTVQGTAHYRERIALPPDAVFEAVLQDVSRADAPAEELGRARLAPAGQPPFRFEIAYEDAALRPGRRYAVRASVSQGGRLLFTTDRTYPVLDGRGAPLKLLLVSARAVKPPRPALTGMFSYLADAASITLCADGQQLPVAMEADYRALEAAYLKAREEPGQALLVSLEGQIASRPAMEAGAPPRPTLVVQRFIAVRPGESCDPSQAESPLRGTYWKLLELGGKPVEVGEKQREPHLILAADQAHVSGSGGCNRVMGGFELEGDRLRFGQIAGTLMACPTGMEQEQEFLKSLAKVERYRISGNRLELLDAAGAPVARFEAVALR